MKPLCLIQWNQDQAEQLARPLREAGWQVRTESQDGARAGRAILAELV